MLSLPIADRRFASPMTHVAGGTVVNGRYLFKRRRIRVDSLFPDGLERAGRRNCQHGRTIAEGELN